MIGQEGGERKQGAAGRLRSAYSTLPDRRGWSFALGQALWLLPLVGALGWLGGFVAWRPAFGVATWNLLVVALVFPALAEETLFRVLLVPRTPRHGWPMAAISLILFLLWHPVQSLLYRVPWHEQAFSPAFLAEVAALGFACSRVWLRTGSVWPCAALHWTVVAIWKALFGAPLFFPHP